MLANIRGMIKSKLIAKADIADAVGISFRTINNWVLAGKLPQPIYIGKKAYWNVKEVEEELLNKFKLIDKG